MVLRFTTISRVQYASCCTVQFVKRCSFASPPGTALLFLLDAVESRHVDCHLEASLLASILSKLACCIDTTNVQCTASCMTRFYLFSSRLDSIEVLYTHATFIKLLVELCTFYKRDGLFPIATFA